MGVSKNWAKEEKRLRIEGVCSVACREKETTQLMGEQMGREAGPNLEPPPPPDFAKVLGSLYLLLRVSGCPLF